MRVPKHIIDEIESFFATDVGDGICLCQDASVHANGRKCRAVFRCRYDVLEESQQEAGFMVNPNLEDNIKEVSNIDPEKGLVTRNRQPVVFCNTPRALLRVGIPMALIVSNAMIIRKCTGKAEDEHGINSADMADIPDLLRKPVAVFRDGDNYVVLTDRRSPTSKGTEKPIMVYLRPCGDRGPHNFIASAYPREPEKEGAYVKWAKSKGGLVFIDESRIAEIGLEDETTSQLKPQTAATLDAYYCTKSH